MTFFLGFEPGEITRAVFEPVVREHADEAAFLWHRRAQAVDAPDYNLKDLVELDNRVDAHVDGLRLAGESAWRMCEENLSSGTGEVFAATAFAMRAEPDALPARLDAILAEVAQRPELRAGLVSGIGFSPWSRVHEHAASWLESDTALLRGLGLAAFRAHRRPPPESALRQAFHTRDLQSQLEVIRIAGELKLHLPELVHPISAGSPGALRLAWARSLLLLQHAGPAMSVLGALVGLDSPESGPASELLVRRMEKGAALDWLHSRLRGPHLPHALLIAGAAGYPELVEPLLELMDDATVARRAGFAFTLLTGADLEYLDLDREPPASRAEDTDEIRDDPDEALPWPDAARVREWWSRNAGDYRPGQRYLMGRPIGRENLQRVLASGRQPHRRAAALELALLDAKTPLYATSKPGTTQARELLGWP